MEFKSRTKFGKEERVNSPGPVFGPRLQGAGQAQWPKRLVRPRPVGAERARSSTVTSRGLGAAGRWPERCPVVMSLPLKRMVSLNQDHYRVQLPK
jgi:hypothetical protein